MTDTVIISMLCAAGPVGEGGTSLWPALSGEEREPGVAARWLSALSDRFDRAVREALR